MRADSRDVTAVPRSAGTKLIHFENGTFYRVLFSSFCPVAFWHPGWHLLLSSKLSDLPTFSLKELLRGLRTKSFSSSLSDGPHSDNENLPVLSPRRAGSGQKADEEGEPARKLEETDTFVQGIYPESPGMAPPSCPRRSVKEPHLSLKYQG